MIIYNKTWLNNLILHNRFEDDADAGCLTQDEVKTLKAKYLVGFYMPGIVIRIGLFILTFIIVFFSAGLFSLFLADARIIDNFGWPLLLGVCSYIVLERMVKSNHYYQSGVDEALLWITASLLAGGLIWMLFTINSNANHYISSSTFVFLLSLYFTLRFADLPMSAIACFSVLAFTFFVWQNLGSFGMATMPFIMMLVSAGIYWGALNLNINPKALHYNRCLNVAQVVSLVALYLSGNYLVVNELSNEINNTPNAHLPFGFIFWLWTILMPFIYIGFGIKNKSSILLRTGLLLIAAAVFTFRNYYHILPLEVAFTVAGAVLLAVSYGVIKYLKTPKHGFTYAEPNRKNLIDQLNVESLIVGETFANTPTGPTGPQSPFGGGSAGGGGSSSVY